MNKTCFIVFMLLTRAVFATEFDSLFYAHLKNNNLHLERYSFLKQELKDGAALAKETSLDYYKLIRMFNDSASFSNINFEQLSKDTSNLKLGYYLSIHFRNQAISNYFLAHLKPSISTSTFQVLNECYEVMYQSKTSGIHHSEFANIQGYRQQMERKKAWLAALLSAVLPGMGKVYLGQKQTGYTELAMCLLLGIVPVEILLVGGVITAGVIVGAALFIPFYISGIYGAAVVKRAELRRCNRELKNEVQAYCDFMFTAH